MRRGKLLNFRSGKKRALSPTVLLVTLCTLSQLASAYAEETPPAQEPSPLERAIPGRETGQGISLFSNEIYESVPDQEYSSASEFVSVPDRWAQFYKGKWYDPYNQNILKGDLPIFGEPGEEWFMNLSLISDSMYEARRVPIPVGGASTHNSGSINTFGDGQQNIFSQTLLTSFSLIRGDTTFRPPDYELRFTPVLNFNYADVDQAGALRVDPARGDGARDDSHIGIQELFADMHLANLDDRYDFISVRGGIQKFSSDFQGFVYSDEQPGVRLFGNYDNNKIQSNLAWFSRLDKDTNSGLNTFDNRHEQVVIANLYLQDLLALGHTTQFNIIHREDTAGDYGQYYNDNGFLTRPGAIGDERNKNLYTTYLGATGSGHFDRINSNTALYYVMGSESHNAIAQQSTDISAGMAAQEFSYDMDWIRFRASALWASGDSDPHDGSATGFDAIKDNPNFAGGDLSYFQREGIPFIGGGGVNLVGHNSFLPNLTPGKEEGQANFVNPGLRMYNLGVDFEVLPELKLINNVSFLQFDQTEVLETLRHDGSINRSIGYDLSTGVLYRPFLNNNVQFRLGGGALITDNGFDNLFGDKVLYHVFTNAIFQY